MTRRLMKLAALAAAVLVPLAACDDTTGPDTGRLSIMLTDAPGDFEEAVVTIDEIYLQGEADDGRVVLMEDPVTTDLLTLANDVESLVEDAVVPSGSYGQLRFVVSGAYIRVENESGGSDVYATSTDYGGLPDTATVDGTLQTPSFDQTGIKVNLPGGAVDVSGEQKVLVVDFDVSQSFGQEAGAAGMWVMTPVLNATDFGLTGGVTASLELADTVELPTVDGSPVTLADFSAVLSNADGSEEELALSDGDDDGVFDATFQYLEPGDFQIEFGAPDGVTFTTDPATPIDVSAASGQTAEASATVTSAE